MTVVRIYPKAFIFLNIRMENNLWQHIPHLRNTSPLFNSFTNYVVMNNTANALLAIGASPIIAYVKLEVEDISNALVINIGHAINLCNQVASGATHVVREKMTKAFISSSRMEYPFLENAYELKKQA